MVVDSPPGDHHTVEAEQILGPAHRPGGDVEVSQRGAMFGDVSLQSQHTDLHLEAPRWP